MDQIVLFLALFGTAQAHIAAWSPGMYCLNGTTPGVDNGNTNNAANPLFMLKKADWWMHHVDKCDEFPPAPGNFLELPANGKFTVELATNRAFTTFSSNGAQAGVFPGPLKGGTKSDRTEGEEGAFQIGREGADHEVPGCIVDPNMHTQNETMASGTAFAISYTSNIDEVTMENLVVFTVLEHTPFRRLATYEVPDLPACPPGGCICTWGWIPNGCGEPNMYFFPYRCTVTGTPSKTNRIAMPAKPAAWCDITGGSDAKLPACSLGPKQMLVWNQLEGDNIKVLEGRSDLGSPGYNDKLGFRNGAQTDIFETIESTPENISSTVPISATSSSTAFKSRIGVTAASIASKTVPSNDALSSLTLRSPPPDSSSSIVALAPVEPSTNTFATVRRPSAGGQRVTNSDTVQLSTPTMKQEVSSVLPHAIINMAIMTLSLVFTSLPYFV